MKYITKTKDRIVELVNDADGVHIKESNRYLPTGYLKHAWERQNIFLTADEARRIADVLLEIAHAV